MSDNGRCLTFDIDGILFEQIKARAGVTGRSKSSEVAYLTDQGLRMIARGEAEVFDQTQSPQRVCIYFTGATMAEVVQYAVSNHIPKGRAVNTILRTFLDATARAELRLFAPLPGRAAPASE